MLSQMNHINHAGRTIILFAKNQIKNLGASKVSRRTMTSANIQGIGEPLIYTTSTILPDSGSTTQKSQNDPDPIDKKVSMIMLRKNFSVPGPGLKVARNRNNLVLDFFNLSKSVIENRLCIEDFEASDTFKKLQEQIEQNIDIMGNAIIVNLLASVIKMRINPSTNLVKLLEHEVKFRIKAFNINQIIKMLKFYNSTEMSSEQKQLADMLSFRIRAYIQNEAFTVKDLNLVLRFIANEQDHNSLLALIEERLLYLLTIHPDDDDLVSKYLTAPEVYDYESLCDLFINLAENRRRPTPLLKAASIELCKISSSKESFDKQKLKTIISTLNALVKLSYPNRTLISKLMSDLTEIFKLDELDSSHMCNLLRSIGNLRWRPDDLLKMLFSHIEKHNDDYEMIDHHVIVSLLHVAALVNYRSNCSMKQFYEQCMKGKREQLLDKHSRKWLNYVWSLVALKVADEFHIRSVLNNEFYQSIETSSGSTKIGHSDLMKLLNLRAIAYYELKITGLDCKHLDRMIHQKIQRGLEMQKLASKIHEALNGIVSSSSEMRTEIQTPFGFVIDCELLLNENLEPITLDDSNSIEKIILSNVICPSPSSSNYSKCALIYASYDDTIVNIQEEVVGHKQIISRILQTIGYKTVFLPETLINREKTSADLSNRLKTMIKTSLSSNNLN